MDYQANQIGQVQERGSQISWVHELIKNIPTEHMTSTHERKKLFISQICDKNFVPEYGFDKTCKIDTWSNEEIQRWNPIKKNDKTISMIRRIPTTVNQVTKHWKRILSREAKKKH